MSGDLLVKNKALRKIRHTLISTAIPAEVKVCFVLSYPRSDMGKGTLIAQLLATNPCADAIKFDGLLNTNESGRHTARGHDDFGIYERFNPGRTWGSEHYILGGELHKDFIASYGEYENLRIQQHLSLHLEAHINAMWETIGGPQLLFIEVGGVLTDPEVEPLIAPLIQRMMRERSNTEVILLTESEHNGEYVKTKSIQDGVSMLIAHGITPTIIAAREPEALRNASDIERIECERAIINRIDDNLGHQFYKTVSVPHFSDDTMSAYTEFVARRITPYLQPNHAGGHIVVGTKNKAKYRDFNLYLGDAYTLVKGGSDRDVEIPEGLHSLEENAIAKARTWCILTGQVAAADDTGFFISALNGEPGVAARRWGGELPETATNEQFWKLLQQKTANLDDTSAYFDQCTAIVAPNGVVKVIHNRTVGYLDREKLKLPYNGTGYPLAAAFVANERTKSWDEMSDEEKKAFDKQFIAELYAALDDIYHNKPEGGSAAAEAR